MSIAKQAALFQRIYFVVICLSMAHPIKVNIIDIEKIILIFHSFCFLGRWRGRCNSLYGNGYRCALPFPFSCIEMYLRVNVLVLKCIKMQYKINHKNAGMRSSSNISELQ